MLYQSCRPAKPMNKSRASSVAGEVRRRILRGMNDKLWSFEDFADLDPLAVAAALSRLNKTGELRRVRRGLYHRPRITAFGASSPDPDAVADAAMQRAGVKPLAVGVAQYNRLGLTTQVSGTEIVRASARPMRPTSPARGLRLRTRVRPLHRQPNIQTEERTALDALREVRSIPDANPEAVLKRLKTLLSTGRLDYGRLAGYALAEPPRVRALLGALGEDLLTEPGRVEPAAVQRLRASLNAFSRYRVPGAERVLTHAAAWRIVSDPV